MLAGAKRLGAVVVVALGAAACAGSVATKSPAAAGVSGSSVGAAATVTTHAANAPATPTPPPAATVAPGPTAVPATTAPTAAPTTAKVPAGRPPSSPAAPASPAPTATTPVVPAAPTTTLAPRRQPTSGEIAQVIANVKAALPFVTLTSTQVTQAGAQVCSAFDQGQTFAAVTAQVLSSIGGAALAGLVPSSVPAGAVRTLVTMFCPGYLVKLG